MKTHLIKITLFIKANADVKRYPPITITLLRKPNADIKH